MLRRHLDWREELPEENTAAVEALLSSERFQLLRSGRSPLLAIDFMWGGFLDGVEFEDAVSAFVAVLESIPALSGRDTAAPGEDDACLTIVCIGGPPPIAWARAASAIFEANYPGRLARAIAYPVPSWVSSIANSIVTFLPSQTRRCFSLCSNEAQLRELTGLEELPSSLQLTTVLPQPDDSGRDATSAEPAEGAERRPQVDAHKVVVQLLVGGAEAELANSTAGATNEVATDRRAVKRPRTR